jgi:two-component system chemotaxis sensor kinase CheA
VARDPFKYFRVEARDLLEQFHVSVLALESGGSSSEAIHKLLRLAHTLKGAARVVKQSAIAEQAHAIEDLLQPLREAEGPVARATLDQVLQCLQAIQALLAALAGPTENETSRAKVQSSTEEEARTVRTELAEVDDLLLGIGETHTQLRALQTTAAGLEHARQLAELLVEQLTRRSEQPDANGRIDKHGTDGSGRLDKDGRMDKPSRLAAELQRLVRGLEQKIGTSVEQVQRELGQVHAAAQQLRLVPARTVFTSLERTARDTARELGKHVVFQGAGGSERLDAHLLEVVRGALVQLIRNAVAHGIEAESERLRSSKPAAGQVRIQITRSAGRVTFRCTDDGRGIDLERVRSALAQRNATMDPARLGREELLRELLRGGISTATSVSQLAGRGIGLDVVREAAERLRGHVSLESDAGRGTTFELTVPLSVAALEGLVVEAGGALATIPLSAVRRTLRVTASDVSRTERGESLVYDGQVLPFLPLRRALRRKGPAAERHGSAVVVEANGLAAVGVDRLLGTATVVIRPLPEHAPADPLIAGASLDAEGNPQVVIDPAELVAAARRTLALAEPKLRERRSVLIVDDSMTTRMLEQSILESAGYDVDTASSAEEGLERARSKQYALFLVDVEMPGMDGFGFVETTRRDAALGATPAILVTSLSEPEHQRRAREVGAQGYVIKSEFDQADLLQRIQRLVG